MSLVGLVTNCFLGNPLTLCFSDQANEFNLELLDGKYTSAVTLTLSPAFIPKSFWWYFWPLPLVAVILTTLSLPKNEPYSSLAVLTAKLLEAKGVL